MNVIREGSPVISFWDRLKSLCGKKTKTKNKELKEVQKWQTLLEDYYKISKQDQLLERQPQNQIQRQNQQQIKKRQHSAPKQQSTSARSKERNLGIRGLTVIQASIPKECVVCKELIQCFQIKTLCNHLYHEQCFRKQMREYVKNDNVLVCICYTSIDPQHVMSLYKDKVVMYLLKTRQQKQLKKWQRLLYLISKIQDIRERSLQFKKLQSAQISQIYELKEEQYECYKCNKPISSNSVKLECNHRFHDECLGALLDRELSSEWILSCLCNQQIKHYWLRFMPKYDLYHEILLVKQIDKLRETQEKVQKCPKDACEYWCIMAQDSQEPILCQACLEYF